MNDKYIIIKLIESHIFFFFGINLKLYIRISAKIKKRKCKENIF